MNSTTAQKTIKAQDIGSIYCIGRNWAKHAKELNNPIPTTPLIFTKVSTTLCPFDNIIDLPLSLGRCDHELEIAILIDQPLHNASFEQAKAAISHYGIALDLTLRDCQSELKAKGQPWFKAKNFVNALPISPMLPFNQDIDLTNIRFSLVINDEIRQQGTSADMLNPIIDFIIAASEHVPLQPGDLLLTGTPEGVGPLNHQDKLEASINGNTLCQCQINRQ